MLAYRENRLLAALPQESAARLRPHLQLVALQAKQPLHLRNEAITQAYFPLTSVVSLLRRLPDGTAMEVATVGYEGLVGLSLFLDAATTGREAVTQLPGGRPALGGGTLHRSGEGRCRLACALASLYPGAADAG